MLKFIEVRILVYINLILYTFGLYKFVQDALRIFENLLPLVIRNFYFKLICNNSFKIKYFIISLIPSACY